MLNIVSTRVMYFTLVMLFIPSSYAEINNSSTIIELEALANNGELEAQMLLAEKFYSGSEAEQDHEKAAKWFRKLAEQGFAKAQLTLGLMYIQGDGIEKNNIKAIHYLTEAAGQRISTAQYLLGVAYEEGHGVKVDLVTAYMWYEIAAAINQVHAAEAQKKLSVKLTPHEIAYAEQMATDWWLRHHD